MAELKALTPLRVSATSGGSNRNPPMQKKSPLNCTSVRPRALFVLLVCAAACLIVTRTLPHFSEATRRRTFRNGLEKKVADYLRKSQALEDYWQRPISADQLQAEIDRMAEHTKKPEVLRELFAALGDDPFVIAECLARPALADRLLTNWYSYDGRIHAELKQRVEADMLAHPTLEQMKQLSGSYSEIELTNPV
jgi:hypothetical protein